MKGRFELINYTLYHTKLKTNETSFVILYKGGMKNELYL